MLAACKSENEREREQKNQKISFFFLFSILENVPHSAGFIFCAFLFVVNVGSLCRTFAILANSKVEIFFKELFHMENHFFAAHLNKFYLMIFFKSLKIPWDVEQEVAKRFNEMSKLGECQPWMEIIKNSTEFLILWRWNLRYFKSNFLAHITA